MTCYFLAYEFAGPKTKLFSMLGDMNENLKRRLGNQYSQCDWEFQRITLENYRLLKKKNREQKISVAEAKIFMRNTPYVY